MGIYGQYAVRQVEYIRKYPRPKNFTGVIIMKSKLVFCIMILSLALSGCAAEKQAEEKTLADAFMESSKGEFAFSEPGIYGPTEGTKRFDGDVVIDSEDVVLRNLDISGSITISPKVGNGDASLESVTADGTLYVMGGGENSVKIKGGVLPIIEINRPDGRVRIYADQESSITTIVVISSANIDTTRVEEIVVSPDGDGTEILIHGSVGGVTVTGAAKIMVDDKAEIEKMAIEPSASGTQVAGGGSVLSARIDADDVRVDTRMDDYYSTSFPKDLYINGNHEEAEHRYDGSQEMTKESWEVGLPWDAEWGEMPDGAWTPESGIPWKAEWGEEPNDDDFDSDNPDAGQSPGEKPIDEPGEEDDSEESSEKPLPDNMDENAFTKDNWEVGMPWDAEWGEAPDDEDVSHENEPGNEETENTEDPGQEEAKAPISFIECRYSLSGGSVEIEISLTRPGEVYYVFEDISVMMGQDYLPSEDQIMAGLNATGGSDGKAIPQMDEDMEIGPEALVRGSISIDEAEKTYHITASPTSSPDGEDPEGGQLSNLHGSFLAIDQDGNRILKQ